MVRKRAKCFYLLLPIARMNVLVECIEFSSFEKGDGADEMLDVWASELEFAVFSREQRQRAVDLCFGEGMTPGRVIAELGYPSETCLARWVSRDPRYGRRRRLSYTLGFRVGAARRVIDGEHYAAVARDVGCSPASVRRWVDAYGRKGIGGLMAGHDDARLPAAGDGCDDPAELKRRLEALRLENAVLRETIDVLKAGDPRLDPSGLTSRDFRRTRCG